MSKRISLIIAGLVVGVLGNSVLGYNAFASVWQIIPEKSTLTFTAVQNGAPVSGEFRAFQGDIVFDPDHLGEGHIRVEVSMGSVMAPYQEMVDTLATADWFNVAAFPKAVFEAVPGSITKKEDNRYQAAGQLTLRDQTAPTTVIFTLEEYTPSHARVKGEVVLPRTQFGVGQGEWANIDVVKDEVQVTFDIDAVSK